MKRLFDFVNKLLNTRLYSNNTLLDASQIDNLALWWYIDLDFFNFLLRITNQQDDSNKKEPNGKERIRIAFVDRTLRIYDYFLKFISILLVQIFQKSIHDNSGKKLTVLITGEDIEWRPILDSTYKNFRVTDQFFDSIVEHVEKTNKFRFISTYPLKYPLVKSIVTVISKSKNWKVCHIPFNYYFNRKCDNKRIIAGKSFQKIWSDIGNDPLLNKLLCDFDPVRAPLIKQKLKNYFVYNNTENVFPEFVKMLETAKNLIHSVQPDVVILEEEYGFFERSLLIAAKMENIPTIAIQHGVIHELHKAYMFNKGEISQDLSISFPYVQIADKTAVYGEYHKMLLTKISSYPENSVIVTGQPRYDRIITLQKNFDRDKFLIDWKIPLTSKLILWLPAFSYLSDHEIEKDFISILKDLGEIEGLRVVIKPHPGDPNHSIIKLKNKISEFNNNAILIPRNYDALYCMMASDIVMMKDSTTGMEAIALGKPLIQLNLENSKDQIDYVGEGVAFGIYCREDLKTVVSQILNNTIMVSDEMRRHYLEEFFYKIDGQASERIVQLIEQCIKINVKRDSL